MKSELGRYLYRILLVVFWLCVVALAIEAFARVNYYWDRVKVTEFKTERRAAVKRETARMMDSIPAPPRPEWAPDSLPDLATFPALDDAARLEFSEARGEVNVVCAPDGTIEAVYRPSGPAELLAFAHGYAPGGSIVQSLPQAEAEDALHIVRQAAEGQWTGIHEYSLRDYFGSGEHYTVSFVSTRYPGTDGSGARVIVSVFPSKYDIMCHSYRPHYYIDSNKYPFYPSFPWAELWTNAQGFRGDEVMLPKPAGRFRVVCVGGSTTVEGPRNDLTYPALLEDILQEQFSEGQVDVVNCGIDAKDSFTELSRIDDYLALEPDLTIYYTFPNDIYRVYDEQYLSSVSEGSAFPECLLRGLRHSMFLYNTYPDPFLPPFEALRAIIEDLTIAHLEQALEKHRAQGIAMAVCSVAIPDFEQLDHIEASCFDPRYGGVGWGTHDIHIMQRVFDAYNAAARDFCTANEVLYIPVAETVTGGMAEFNDIVHMTLTGIQRKTEVVAETIAPLVAKTLGQEPTRETQTR